MSSNGNCHSIGPGGPTKEKKERWYKSRLDELNFIRIFKRVRFISPPIVRFLGLTIGVKHTFCSICKSGRRSARACQFLEEQGYDVTNVQGGMDAFES